MWERRNGTIDVSRTLQSCSTAAAGEPTTPAGCGDACPLLLPPAASSTTTSS